MPKRFTDTDKWKKPFIRSLPLPYKLFWFYLLDDCNHAGIWEVDMEVASIRIGEKLEEKKALELFADRVHLISNSKWFVMDFILFQYGELSEKNRLHVSVINILNKYKIEIIKGLISPLQGVKEQYKDKVKDKEQDKDKDKEPFGKSENLLLIPEMYRVFENHNPTYPGSKDQDYKPLFSIATFFCKIGKLQGSPDLHKDKIIEVWEVVCKVIMEDKFYKQKTLGTISNQIQELLQMALYGKSNGKQNYGSKERSSQLNRMFDEFYGKGGSTVN